MNAALARQATLVALWVQIAAMIASGVYGALSGSGPRDSLWWLSIAGTLLAVTSLALWTLLLGGYLRGLAAPEHSGLLRAFRRTFPWLIALNAALLLVISAAVMTASLSGLADEVNPLAALLYFLASGTGLVTNLAIFAVTSLLFTQPDNPLGRARLLTWLNVSAAASVAFTIMSVWPPAGLLSVHTLADQLISGVQGLLDVAVTLLLMQAVRLLPAGRE